MLTRLHPIRWSGALLTLALSLSGCTTFQTAFVQPQSRTYATHYVAERPNPVAADTLPVPAAPTYVVASTAPNVVSAPPAEPTPVVARPRVPNPDATTSPKRHRWLLGSETAHYKSFRQPTTLRQERHVPKLAYGALAASVAPYGLLLLPATAATTWLLIALLPVSAVLMGITALTRINRNREKYQGRGVAAAAILLGTGFVGMALVALAALASAGVMKH